jgi:predicted helicase
VSEAALKGYVAEIAKYYEKGIATEHTYRDTLKRLLESFNTDTNAFNEPKRSQCGAPDYMVERNNLTIGYVEAKDIGKPLDVIEKDEQLKRYLRALDNLILTDYLEFRWYVNGEKRMIARLATLKKNKNLTFDADGAVKVTELLVSFLDHNAETIKKPQDLAKRMARLTHMIRDIIVEAFHEKEASANLKDLYIAFQDTLLPGLKETDFADMFSQTIAYGLFAARYNYTKKKPFARSDAATAIPRTNPFLRKLFGTITGPDLDDEPFVGFVDELAQVLAFTDMEAVLVDFGKKKRQEDPIVHFYETFLAQYDPKLRELRGVYYTPDPVVSYIVRSVDYLLKTHFDCPDGLADTSTVPNTSTNEKGETHTEEEPRVLILDPATGTSTFLYHIIAHVRESYQQMGNAGMWSGYVREHLLRRLFGFELLMAPYAMAHLKLAMQLAALDLSESVRKTWAYDFKTDERLGIYLTNTLDEALKRSDVLFGRYISDEANEAAKVKQGYPVMVVLGNPPYSGHSANSSWKMEGKKKVPNFIGKLLQDYYQVDGKPLQERNSKWLQDDYVKFIRFAQWRIQQTGYGILAFITNHGYLDNPTFRGMRQSLMQTFDEIYVLDLHGNSKKKERTPGGEKDENVFDIQQGVAIGIFVKRQSDRNSVDKAKVYHAHLWGEREIFEKVEKERRLVGGKYYWLAENDVATTNWKNLEPSSPLHLFIPQNMNLKEEYEHGFRVADIFLKTLLGPNSHRDDFAISFTREDADRRINDLADRSISDEMLQEKYNLKDNRDWSLQKARKNKLIGIAPVACIYRPFDFRYMLYGPFAFDYHRPEINDQLLQSNVALISTKQTKEHFSVLATNLPAGQHKLVTPYDGSYLSPLYLYPNLKKKALFEINEMSNTPNGRRPNLSPAFIEGFSAKIKLQFIPDSKGDLYNTFGPEDIFNYMYAIFYSLIYRQRYAEFLKIDFPRLPLTSDMNLFRSLCELGEKLVRLHLMSVRGKKIPLRFPVQGSNIVEKVAYTYTLDEPEKGRVWINKEQYIEGIEPEVWEFYVGGYQVCQKWLKDRKGHEFTHKYFEHYQGIVSALSETITLMEQIDETIDEHGGWPIE